MISKTLANNILDILVGNSYKLSGYSAVYLGLSSTDPEEGLTEPAEEEYKRIQVGATDQGTSATNTTNGKEEFSKFRRFAAATGGVVSNKDEINFPTAKQGYKDKITHWFLSSSSSKGSSAFLWGEVKDVLIEPADWTEFTQKTRTIYADTENEEVVQYLEKEIELEDLITITTDEEYVVVWDKNDNGKEVEYKLTASVYKENVKVKEENEQGEEVEKEVEITHSLLGNPWLVDANLTDTGVPFVLLYHKENVETETIGKLKILTSNMVSSHRMGLYGMGLEVGKKTVPTFYQGQLQASIDVEL